MKKEDVIPFSVDDVFQKLDLEKLDVVGCWLMGSRLWGTGIKFIDIYNIISIYLSIILYLSIRFSFILSDIRQCSVVCGLRDVEGWPGAAVSELLTEYDVEIAGSFELAKDDFIHAVLGFDQNRGDDGERTSFLESSGRREQLPWHVEGSNVQAAGADGSGQVG